MNPGASSVGLCALCGGCLSRFTCLSLARYGNQSEVLVHIFRQAGHCSRLRSNLSPVEATPTVRKTALNAVHRQMGAKMVEFNGWDMPVGVSRRRSAAASSTSTWQCAPASASSTSATWATSASPAAGAGRRPAHLDERRVASWPSARRSIRRCSIRKELSSTT